MYSVIAALSLDGAVRIMEYLGGIILDIAPAAIVLSYVICGLVWIISGGNSKMVKFAREQFVATTVVMLVIGGFHIVKALALALGSGGFG